MAGSIQRLGILTGGGDCPGLNAVIRAVTKTAIYKYGLRVFGIEDGFLGLIENRIGELTSIHVSGILTRGGSILGCNNRCNPARVYCGVDSAGEPIVEDRIDTCLEVIEANRLDALIVVGGDGTMTCTAPFVERGIPCIGVPKTIDNDIIGTDLTFGFQTAMATATEALDRLHSTAASHHRVMVCELMGRNAGWLTLYSGAASGSDVILLPEIPFDLDIVCEFVRGRTNRGRGFSIVACAEGARLRDGEQIVKFTDPSSPDPIRLGGIGQTVADVIGRTTGIETRTTVLGHVQRGGSPVATDRVLATQFGYRAIELLQAGKSGRLVVKQNGHLSDIDIRDVAGRQRLVELDHELVEACRAIKTSFGDR
jgi:6-phosphofructokinase 1